MFTIIYCKVIMVKVYLQKLFQQNYSLAVPSFKGHQTVLSKFQVYKMFKRHILYWIITLSLYLHIYICKRNSSCNNQKSIEVGVHTQNFNKSL